MPLVAVGVLPSSVKRIETPALMLEMVMDCVESYVPPGGSKMGAAAGGCEEIVYVAVLTALSVVALLKAIAFNTVSLLMVIGPLYTVPVVAEGVVPFVVKRIVAPGVVVLIATDCGVA